MLKDLLTNPLSAKLKFACLYSPANVPLLKNQRDFTRRTSGRYSHNHLISFGHRIAGLDSPRDETE